MPNPPGPAAAVAVPAVSVHVWTLRRRHLGFGLRQAAAPSALIRARTGARFAKLLGTGRGETFTVSDAQPLTWALVAAWPDEPAARAFDGGRWAAAWSRRSASAVRLALTPLSARGTWSGAAPFAPVAPALSAPAPGPVAALTRARIRPRRLLMFRRAVGPVAAQLRSAPGCRWAIGIGEAPIGWQGTLSIWDDAAALRRFAYGPGPHAGVVARTPEAGWYAEELFARFAVTEAAGLPSSSAPAES